MPRRMKGRSYGSGRRRRKMMGGGLFDWIKTANNWLRSNKVISTVGNALSGIPVIGNVAGTVGSIADTLGYGRRRYHKRLVGGRRRRSQRGGFLGIAGH